MKPKQDISLMYKLFQQILDILYIFVWYNIFSALLHLQISQNVTFDCNYSRERTKNRFRIAYIIWSWTRFYDPRYKLIIRLL